MAERFARQRLRAVAKLEGIHLDGKPTVLFLCTHNAGRSQMAPGFFGELAGNQAVAWSDGSEPGGEVDPAANRPRRRRRDQHGLWRCLPNLPGKRYESWDHLADPASLDLSALRLIRDDIERRVRKLIHELGLASTADQRLGHP